MASNQTAYTQPMANGFLKEEIRIVLIGRTGSGKSATGNTLVGKQVFESKLCGSSVTKGCQHEMVDRFSRKILVVDTPGLFDTETNRNSDMTLQEIKKCMALSSPGLHAIVFVTRLTRFTKEEQDTVTQFLEVFGHDVKKYFMIIMTGKDDLDADGISLDEFLNDSPEELRTLIDSCQGRCFSVNNFASEEEKNEFTIRFLEEIDKMVESNGGGCYTTSMYLEAEGLLKQREEEIKKQLEEQQRTEQVETEMKIRSKYEERQVKQAGLIETYQNKVEAFKKSRDAEIAEQRKYCLGLEKGKQKLEAEMLIIEEDMKKEKRKNENDRDREAMAFLMKKMEENRRIQENDNRRRHDVLIKELQKREETMRMDYELRKRKEDEEREQLSYLMKENQKLKEEMTTAITECKQKYENMLEQAARKKTRSEVSRSETSLLKRIGAAFHYIGDKLSGPDK